MKETEPDTQHYPVKENPFWLTFEACVQKYGAVLLTFIVIAALCGAFSEGFLSKKTRQSGDQKLAVHYERFGRLQSDMNMTVTALSPAHQRVVITLDGDFMQQYEIRTLQPQPTSMSSENGALRLEYTGVRPGAAFDVWLGLTPLLPGRSTQQISMDGAQSVAIGQFIYP